MFIKAIHSTCHLPLPSAPSSPPSGHENYFPCCCPHYQIKLAWSLNHRVMGTFAAPTAYLSIYLFIDNLLKLLLPKLFMILTLITFSSVFFCHVHRQLPILVSSLVSLYFLEWTDVFKPVKSGFNCHDRSLSLPYIDPNHEVIPLLMLLSLAFAGPAITVRIRKRNQRQKTMRQKTMKTTNLILEGFQTMKNTLSH